MNQKVRVAILSDLHFSEDPKSIDKTHAITSKATVKKQDPISDLYDLISDKKLSADILLCPGDITLAASVGGLNAAWEAVNKTGTILGCREIVATTGNHDLESRETFAAPDILDSLKALRPNYPNPKADELERLRYFANHHMEVVLDDVRIISLNTCATHARGEVEYKHGRITDRVIEEISARISQGGEYLVNIILCHHHPAKHPDLSEISQDYSEMSQGAKFLQMLDDSKQCWLVVHGHKHSPRLTYSNGSSAAPIILSAGSLSAVLSPVHFPATTNQFYIVEFDRSDLDSFGLTGTVDAWDWAKGAGWTEAIYDHQRTNRISKGTGFGVRINHAELAAQIAKSITPPAAAWPTLLKLFPKIKYLLPRDLFLLLDTLERKHGWQTVQRDSLDPQQLVSLAS